MAYVLANGLYPVIFGSRILGRDALKGGMPLYKYIANRILTLIENLMLGEKLTEYHTGYRAYTREVLENINYKANSDDFIFDNQIIAQIFNAGYRIAEISCPTKYFTEASSISFRRSVKYGLGVLKISCQYRLNKWKLKSYRYLKPIKYHNKVDRGQRCCLKIEDVIKIVEYLKIFLKFSNTLQT